MAYSEADKGAVGPDRLAELDILWITAGLGCDGDTIAMTAATQPSIEDIVGGGLPWIPKVNLYHPFLAYDVGEDFLEAQVSVPCGGHEHVGGNQHCDRAELKEDRRSGHGCHPELREVFQLGNRVTWVTPSGKALIIVPDGGREEMSDEDIDRLFS